MKDYFVLIALAFTLQFASGQNKVPGDNHPVQNLIEQAKINNSAASEFFLNCHYNSTITSLKGNVLVSFIVRTDGQIDSIKLLNDADTLWEETALIALSSSSGKWNPARIGDILIDKKYFGAFNFTNSGMFFYKKDKCLRLLKSGQTTKPLKLITEALNINPFDPELLIWRAGIYNKQDKKYLELIDLLMAEKVKSDVLFNIWFN